MGKAAVAQNYRDLERLYPLRRQIRSAARDVAIHLFSFFPKVDSAKEWIRFPFYHHVFDDERRDFKRHMRFFKNSGDFIALDDAVDILRSKKSLGGRYFCINFDDGFKSCIKNALPILLEDGCPAAFFLATDYIGSDIGADQELNKRFFRFFSRSTGFYQLPVEFLSWDDCRDLMKAGMSIGSHGASHAILTELSDYELRSELFRSKERIDQELGIDCRHFCPPLGIPGMHFKVIDDLKIAKEAGYESLLTGQRGANLEGADPFTIRRDYMLARWGDHQLRYFCSR